MKSLIYKHLQVNKHVAWTVVDKKLSLFIHAFGHPAFISR